jgi:hypothetical protein
VETTLVLDSGDAAIAQRKSRDRLTSSELEENDDDDDDLECCVGRDSSASDPSAHAHVLLSARRHRGALLDGSLQQSDKPVRSDEAPPVDRRLCDGAVATGRTGIRTKRWAPSTFWVFILSMVPIGAWADSNCPASPPYALLRQDEDYSYLRDVKCRRDFMDPIKFIPLSTQKDRYLSLGGEVREWYEAFQNANWGRDRRIIMVTCFSAFASTNIADVTLARASRVTPAVAVAQAALSDAMSARDRECKGGVGKFCREREAAVIERRQALGTATQAVGQTADPQTDAASRIVAWATHGALQPTGNDFAMLRLALLALLPQIGGILLMVGNQRNLAGGMGGERRRLAVHAVKSTLTSFCDSGGPHSPQINEKPTVFID